MSENLDGIVGDGLEVAIVGMALRIPGASSIEQFWQNLRDGVESIRFLSDEELDAMGIPKETYSNPRFVRAYAVLPDTELFDAAFFGIPPREAENMDPQQRFFMEVSHEAIENAGYAVESYPGLIGVFGGTATSYYMLFNLLGSGLDLGNVLQLRVGNEKDFLATRISYKLDLRGPSVNVQTGCSTSLVATHLACQSLLSYQCDMALAGGVSLQLPGSVGYAYEEGGVMSADGHCRSFSSRAQGAVGGSGVGIVVLKRLADAVRDGDTIHAVIKGSAINNDGAAKVGYTAPAIDGQARVIDMAQAAAGVEPRSISYVEAHGSATPLGDPIEVAALTRAFRARTDDRQFCALGSVKTNVGHLDTAAGVAGLIKTVLSLENEELPPSLHFDEPNPEIDFASSPFYVNARLSPWPRGKEPRRAGVSSFGIGGTNAHVIVEEAPLLPPSPPARHGDLILLSARSAAALDRATDNLAGWLERNPGVPISDVAFTLQEGRRRFAFRRALVTRDGEGAAEVAEALGRRDPARLLEAREDSSDRRAAFLFPGLGDHYPGMGAGLYENEPVFRREVDRAAEILMPLLGLDVRTLLFPPDSGKAEEGTKGPDLRRMLGRAVEPQGLGELARTAIAQPALFVIENALAALWESWGIKPVALLGYSLGEYVAAHRAGVFSLADALLVVAERAHLIEEHVAPSAMLAIPLPVARVEEQLGGKLSIAAINGPEFTVVAGLPEDVEALARRLTEEGVTTRPLPTTHAFHSYLMEPIAARVTEIVSKVRLSAPTVPLISNVTGQSLTAAEATDPGYWAIHLRQPVRFGEGLAAIWRDGGTALLELGPGQSLTSLALQHPAAMQSERLVLPSLKSSWERTPDGSFLLSSAAKLWLAGARFDWAGFHAEGRRRRLPLPTYPLERKRYWIERRLPLGAVLAGSGEGEAPLPPSERPETPLHERPHLRNPYVAPTTDVEIALAGLWRSFLGIAEIGVHDNFFELGGHSLMGTDLVNRGRTLLGVDLPLGALFESPTIAGMAAAVEAARQGAGAVALAPVPRTGDLPLSFAQSRMWFLDRLLPGTAVYNIPFAVALSGELDVAALEAAVGWITVRHEALRTTFPTVGGQPSQVISPPSYEPWPIVTADFSALPEEVRETAAGELARAVAQQPFSLAEGPLFRLGLARLGANEWGLILCMHHIVSDGWSMGVFLGEMAALYEDLRQGRAPSLPPLSIQYADFAAWQTRHLSGETLAAHLSYWQEKLAGRPSVLELPFDRPRGQANTGGARRQGRLLSTEIAAAVHRLSEAEGVTPFIALLAATAAFLGRAARQDDVLVGTPIANRTRTEVAPLIGFFVNSLVLRTRLSGDPTYGELLPQVRETALGAFSHQDLPFEKLVEEIAPERALAVNPLFQVMFAYQNAPLPAVDLPGLTLRGLPAETGAAMFDLSVTTAEAGENLVLSIEYAVDLFDEATADRLLTGLELLIGSALAAPDRPLSLLPIVSEEESRQLLSDWRSGRAVPRDEGARLRPVFAAVAEHARRAPDALAVDAPDGRLSYGELDRAATRLARELRSFGVGPEVPVALCFERGAGLVVGALATLRAGGAYVPLDPTYPLDRLAYSVADSGAPVVVTVSRFLDRLPRPGAEAPALQAVLVLDDLEARTGPADGPDGAEGEGAREVWPDQLAYVIYTSGSTGRPKGVEVPHRGLANLIARFTEMYALTAADRGTLVVSPGFDVSVLETWMVLANGGSLHVPDAETRVQPARLLRFLADRQVTVCHLPTVLAEAVLAEALPSDLALRYLWAGGDKLRFAPREELPFSFWNLYGPTENSIATTLGPVSVDPTGRGVPPIGHSIGGYRNLILDPAWGLVPSGFHGELAQGGLGLARGYRGRPELTAAAFVPDPFGDGDRLYHSGDLARRLPDGDFAYLGRLDNQVKVRGFRIEPGEIEAAIARQPVVREAAVVAQKGEDGGYRLVAFITPRDPGKGVELPSALRRTLRTVLPEYMVPTAFVVLPELPLSPNGKLDRKALSEMPVEAESGELTPPRTALEERLVTAAAEILGRERVGVFDNFFELGGHSLSATRMLALLADRHSIEIPLQAMFETANFAELADWITDQELKNADDAALADLFGELEGLSDEELQALLAEGKEE